jgi:hypothetical protein
MMTTGLVPQAGRPSSRPIAGATHEAHSAEDAPLRRISGRENSKSGLFDSLGFHYTSWGLRHSLGSLTTTALKHLTLSAPAREIGIMIQGGHDSGLRYWAGAAVKGLASITGAAAGVVGGAVSVGEAVVSNLGGAALRLLGAGALGVAGAVAKGVGLLGSPSADHAGTVMLRTARDLATGISFLRKGEQTAVPPGAARRVAPLAMLARISGSGKLANSDPPQGFLRMTDPAEIPETLLSVEGGGTGEAARLRLSPKGQLAGDKWSALKIGVFSKADAQGGTTYYLSFVGTQFGRRIATVKSDLAQGIGIEDSAFQEADAVVKAFVDKYGKDSVHVIGHSLGGALAQWAGIRNGVPVTAFNSAGLHINLRNQLGAHRIDEARVEHFNTARDPLSQVGEGRRSPLDASSQVGQRYLIPNSKGHRMEAVVAGLENAGAAQYEVPRDAADLPPARRASVVDRELTPADRLALGLP